MFYPRVVVAPASPEQQNLNPDSVGASSETNGCSSVNLSTNGCLLTHISAFAFNPMRAFAFNPMRAFVIYQHITIERRRHFLWLNAVSVLWNCMEFSHWLKRTEDKASRAAEGWQHVPHIRAKKKKEMYNLTRAVQL